MKLSELKTGQEAYIKNIEGCSSVKRRINELGFTPGRKIKAIKSAPLKDPVEYQILDYQITIRQKDAALINIEQTQSNVNSEHKNETFAFTKTTPSNKSNIKEINIALVGNPNCGKTTIFNHATKSKEQVANYSGVTVAAKKAVYLYEDYKLNIIDLPGTYSLSAYSPEELFVADYLYTNTPDFIINVIDSGNLERNLYLTSQLLNTGINTIVALNMFDEIEGKTNISTDKLEEIVGIPFVPTIGKTGKGLDDIFSKIVSCYKNNNLFQNHASPIFDEVIETSVLKIKEALNKYKTDNLYVNKSIVLQLLENDKNALTWIKKEYQEKFKEILENEIEISNDKNIDISSHIVNQRYLFINELLAGGNLKESKEKKNNSSFRLDKLLTHKVLGLPIFFLVIWFIFFCTFNIGEYPMQLFDTGISVLSNYIANILPVGIVNDLLIEGVIGGVGGVIVFLPNIMILFFLISLLEDSGYMARTSFLMDKLMSKAGLNGKSFIPLLIGFGCNVPAVMATRTIENKRDRIITMFIIPFMSCSARLPVYVLFISAFFPFYQSIILFSLYAIGIIAAFLTALIMNKTVFRKAESAFIMEMPPYRFPSLKSVSKHTWFKTTHFLKKMGTIILFASIIIWALSYFPYSKNIEADYNLKIETIKQESNLDKKLNHDSITLLESEKQNKMFEHTYMSKIGDFIHPIFKPLGFDKKMSISILTGIAAKEIVVSSMGILYQTGAESDENSISLIEKLRTDKKNKKTPNSVYFGFLVFTLLYFPCMGTLIAIKRETDKIKWTLFAAAYPMILAWGVAFFIYQISNVF